jgi:hypothetical protein
MGLTGRGGFRNDTRTNRLQRLHGPEVARKVPPVLPPEEQEKLRQEALKERERYRLERMSKGSPPAKV